ncbi:hypothetical protein AX17_006061 [Amanita inopinata Kibby_2008]|nr:hypothetical protein AX17_006061 [Amanita inopinata Kibby_2008]
MIFPDYRLPPAVFSEVPIGFQSVDTTPRPRQDIESAPISHAGNRQGPRTQRVWMLYAYSRTISIDAEDLKMQRAQEQANSVMQQLHDLMSMSLVPLTVQFSGDDVLRIKKEAIKFLSAFDVNAEWNIAVDGLPLKVGRVISGTSLSTVNPHVAFRFMRFRFPSAYFEWCIQTPCSEVLNCLQKTGDAQVEVFWKMWAKGGTSTGLIACGFTKDVITKSSGNYLVIKARKFIVSKVFLPELVSPIPIPEGLLPYTGQNDVVLFSTSQTVINFLQSSQRNMTVLVALSSLFASLQPVVARYNIIAGFVFAGIGIIAALTSLAAVLVSWTLSWAEIEAAKKRQQE